MHLVNVEYDTITISNTEFEWKETFDSIEYTLLRYRNLLELVKENKPHDVLQIPEKDQRYSQYHHGT